MNRDYQRDLACYFADGWVRRNAFWLLLINFPADTVNALEGTSKVFHFRFDCMD